MFVIKLFKDISQFNANLSTECINPEVKFVNKNDNETTIPLLIVYSYDPKMDNINYKQLADRTISKIAEPATSATAVQMGRRRRRSTTTQSCGFHPLMIQGSDIYDGIVGVTASDFRVSYPQNYNAGICGGTCSNSIPSGSSSNHAPFIHLLLRNQAFKDKHINDYYSYLTGVSFAQCCVPVVFKPLAVLYVANGATNINIIQNMLISPNGCECLDVIQFQ